MKILSIALALTALTATLSPKTFAAPLQPKDVADDPAVLAHIDVDALRTSSIGKSILADQDVQNKLSIVAALFNFDFRTQLHGLTVYTRVDFPKDGVLIVYADVDPERLTALAKAADGAEIVTNDSHIIYSWLGDKKKHSDERKRIYGAIEGKRVVFALDDKDVAHALDVIQDKAPNFVDKEGMPKAEAGESVIAEAVVFKFPFDSDDGNAAIFKMSKSAHLKISESSTNLEAHLRLEATDADTATQISAIAQGLLAVLKLQKGNADVLKLANAVDIKQNGPSVALAVSLPSDEVISTLREKRAEAKEKVAEKAETDKPEKKE
jgi:hypothetical protein